MQVMFLVAFCDFSIFRPNKWEKYEKNNRHHRRRRLHW